MLPDNRISNGLVFGARFKGRLSVNTQASSPSWRAILIAAAVCLPSVSCGSKEAKHLPLYRANGSVSYKGEPLPNAVVYFLPIDEQKDLDGKTPVPFPRGMTQSDGTFAVTTFKPNDGLPPGEYRMTVFCPNQSAPPVDGEYPELLPSRYQDPNKSGLDATIVEGSNELSSLDLE